jgi:hypothetical protein
MKISARMIPDLMKTITCLVIAIVVSGSGHNIKAQIIKVPSDYQ